MRSKIHFQQNLLLSEQALVNAMRILVLCHEFPPIGGGAAAVCAALSAEYRALDNEVVVITMGSDGVPRQEQIDGCEIHRVDCGRRRREMASPWEGLVWANRAWKMVNQLHSRKPFDAVHAHFIMPAGIVAHRLKRQAGVPYIITPHGSDVPGYNRERLKLAHVVARPWWRRICATADRVVCPSASLLHLMQKSLRHFDGHVIPNGFVPGRFLHLKKQKRILLCSRLIERKGFQYFLEAIRDLDLPEWEVDIVGDGPMLPRLTELANRCRVPVHLHGWINNDDPRLAEFYGRASIFAFPSEWENFSIALLEAMSAGCAVITTGISGNPEAIGGTGLLVQPRDVIALREAVQALVAVPDRCVELGRLARARVLDKFDWGVLGREYTDMLSIIQVNG